MIQRQLSKATDENSRSLERLSSGLRINRPSDDSAGLAVSTSLKSSIRVYTQAVRNVGDAVSALSITEDALVSLSSIVTRQNELASQASNGAVSTDQRVSLDEESDALTTEYNRIVTTTSFNGIKVFDPKNGNINIQLGAGQASTISLQIGQALAHANGDGTFGSQKSYAAGTAVNFVATGYIDGDGNDDFITANQNSNDISVFLGNGDGTFKASTLLTGVTAPARVSIEDIDGDGKKDILVGGAASAISVFYGNGNGSFQAARSYDVGGSGVAELMTGDFNSDGVKDIAVANKTTNSVRILLGTSTPGTFAAAVSYNTGPGTQPAAITIDDFNNDGILDIATGNTTNASVSILLGNGNGTFKSFTTFTTGVLPFSVRSSDFDGDGKTDLLVANQSSGSVSVLLGNGDGSFKAQTTISLPGAARAVVIGDFNSDGNRDFAVTDNSNTVSIFTGNGDGTFQQRGSYTGAVKNLAIGDFNNDGVDDLLAAGWTNNNATVYLTKTVQSATVGSLNLGRQSDALAAVDETSQTLDRIMLELGRVSAYQSRLVHATNALQVLKLTYDSAYDAITSVDVAEETAKLLRTEILKNTGTALLAQANQEPKIVLQLLGGR